MSFPADLQFEWVAILGQFLSRRLRTAADKAAEKTSGSGAD
jgi:hypothetical protein